MNNAYHKFNYVKALLERRESIDLDSISDELLYKVTGTVFKLKPKIQSPKLIDDIYVKFYEAYASVVRLLNNVPNNTIKAERSFILSQDVSDIVRTMKHIPNEKYFAYLNALATRVIDVPLTQELLEKTYQSVCSKIDEMEELNPKQRLESDVMLNATKSVLTRMIELNGGKIDNQTLIMDASKKTFYAKDLSKVKLSPEERETFNQLNTAQMLAIRDFVPEFLTATQNGIITLDTLRAQYEELKNLNIFGEHTSIDIKIEMEKVYQALRYTLQKQEGAIDYTRREELLNSYENNIPKIQNEVNIAMLFDSEEYFDLKTLNERVEAIYNLYSRDISDIENQENTFNFEFAYGMAVEKIKESGGRCSSKAIRNHYEEAKIRLEEYKKVARHDNRSPFIIYPKDAKQSPDEIYLNLTDILKDQLHGAIKVGDFDKIYQIVALQKAYKNLLNIANNPNKLRDIEQVTFNVSPTKESSLYTGIGLCDIEYSRTRDLRNIMTIENSMGDEINVTEIGKMGFSTMRRKEKEPLSLYQDPFSTGEYVITKTYYSRANANEQPEQRSFRIFSNTLVPGTIQSDPELLSVYANQIFSDYSLDAAEENNSGLIASAHMIYDKNGKRVPQISFDISTLAACIALKETYKKYLEQEKKLGVKDRLYLSFGEQKNIVGNIPNILIPENSEIRLPKGYATAIFRRNIGEVTETNDEMIAFQWSDILKDKTWNDAVKKTSKTNKNHESR